MLSCLVKNGNILPVSRNARFVGHGRNKQEGQSRQDAEDRHDNNQFDQGKAGFEASSAHHGALPLEMDLAF